MLMYISSWQEKGAELRRCWRGYSFHVLDALEDKDLIRSSPGARSAHLTHAGEEAARELLRKHGLDANDP